MSDSILNKLFKCSSFSRACGICFCFSWLYELREEREREKVRVGGYVPGWVVVGAIFFDDGGKDDAGDELN